MRRSEPSGSERIQMFISPWRSGDHAPRLSTRVVTTTGSGSPVGRAVVGDTGNRQRSAFIPRTAKASRLPSGAMAGCTSLPAPVVSGDAEAPRRT
jgi:hypothetical protein